MRNQSKVLIAALCVAFALGAVLSLARSPAQMEWLNGVSLLLSTFLTFAWYRYDSDARQYRRSYPLNVGVIALSLLALPYYLFRSRGLLSGLLALVLLLVLSIGLGALLFAGALFGLWMGGSLDAEF
jgi:hypothetical protein